MKECVCWYCDRHWTQPSSKKGRNPRYCSGLCKYRAYALRKSEKGLTVGDVATFAGGTTDPTVSISGRTDRTVGGGEREKGHVR